MTVTGRDARRIAKAASAGIALAAMILAGCSGASPQLSPLADGLNLPLIAERLRPAEGAISCGPPGGGGGSMGAGPQGGALAHHVATLTCTHDHLGLDQLAEAWGQAGTAYLRTAGVNVLDPESTAGSAFRSFAWVYTAGASTGVVTVSIVPVGDSATTVIGEIVEVGPRT